MSLINKKAPLTKTHLLRKNAFIAALIIGGVISIGLSYTTAYAQQNNIQLLTAYEGNPEAQFQLALTYSKNTPNFQLAAYWYRQAARQGMANAQYNLGHFYLQGAGVKQDTNETIKWWLQAAHQNYLPAQHNMGTAYFEGIGVEKDDRIAEQWFQRCAKLGSEACIESLQIMRNNSQDGSTVKAQKPIATIDAATSQAPQIKSTTNTIVTEPTGSDNVIPIYINASSNSTIIARLKESPKDSFSILDIQNDWQQVKLKQAIAVWSYKSFVSIKDNVATLTGDNVRARTAPSLKDSKVITELAIGTKLAVLEETEKWVKLAMNDLIAWTPVINHKDNTSEKKLTAALDASTSTVTKPETKLKTGAASEITINDTHQTLIETPKKLVFQYSFIDRRSDDEWLFTSDPEQFTILLGNYDNSKELTRFYQESKLLDHNKAHLLLASRGNIEWKYVLYGKFPDTKEAVTAARVNGFKQAFIAKIGDIQEQRCSSWKTTIPSPKSLDKYCLNETASNS